MRFALEGRFGSAAVAIVVAGAIDGLDGRLARLLKATSRFGAEFDSLADFLCFGVAPAFTLYVWSLQRAGGFGYTPCLMFAVCMALRLARFNAALDAGAGACLCLQLLHRRARSGRRRAGPVSAVSSGWRRNRSGWDWLLAAAQHPLFCAVVLIGTALLLVSTLPVWSFKNFKVPHEYVLPHAARHRDLRRRAGRRSLGGAGRRRPDLPRHAAVQRPQLPPPAARGGRQCARPKNPDHAIAAAKLARSPTADRPRVISTMRVQPVDASQSLSLPWKSGPGSHVTCRRNVRPVTRYSTADQASPRAVRHSLRHKRRLTVSHAADRPTST